MVHPASPYSPLNAPLYRDLESNLAPAQQSGPAPSIGTERTNETHAQQSEKPIGPVAIGGQHDGPRFTCPQLGGMVGYVHQVGYRTAVPIHECGLHGRCSIHPFRAYSGTVQVRDCRDCSDRPSWAWLHDPVGPAPVIQPAKPRPRPVTWDKSKRLAVTFGHGLGDNVHFALQCMMLKRRGFKIAVRPIKGYECLYRAAGVEVLGPDCLGLLRVGWAGHGPNNKIQWGLSHAPLPDIGAWDSPDLWRELLTTTQLDMTSQVTVDDHAKIGRLLRSLPSPVTVLHAKGRGPFECRALDDLQTRLLVRELLDRLGGSVVLLDWRGDVVHVPGWPVRNTFHEVGPLSVPATWELLRVADLVVGIDSGPLHLARLARAAPSHLGRLAAAGFSVCGGSPIIGLWLRNHPSVYSLPCSHALHVTGEEHREHNRSTRWRWGIVESRGELLTTDVAVFAGKLLGGATPRAIQLDQWVRWTRGDVSNHEGLCFDRQAGFSAIIDRLPARAPRMVETGSIRAPDDWHGSGNAGYLLGAVAADRGGVLYTLEIDPQRADFAVDACREFGDAARVHVGNSLDLLGQMNGRIDLAYLDSLDADLPGHAEHNLGEARLCVPHVGPGGMIACDDTWYDGGWRGKGSLTVPWLLDNGWFIVHSGWQTVLSKA